MELAVCRKSSGKWKEYSGKWEGKDKKQKRKTLKCFMI